MKTVHGQSGSSLIEVMISLVILGILVTNFFNAIHFIQRTTASTVEVIEAQTAVESALKVLENLPVDSPKLVDDGLTNDLYNLTTPDFAVNPAGQPWIISVGAHRYGILYNIARDTLVPNMATLQIFAVWSGSSDPYAGERDPMRTVNRVLIRPVASLP